MRSTERTPEKEALYRSTVRDIPCPVQVSGQPTTRRSSSRSTVSGPAPLGLNQIDTIPGKHFPQEDQAPAIADRVATIATRAPQPSSNGRASSLGRLRVTGRASRHRSGTACWMSFLGYAGDGLAVRSRFRPAAQRRPSV